MVLLLPVQRGQHIDVTLVGRGDFQVIHQFDVSAEHLHYEQTLLESGGHAGVGGGTSCLHDARVLALTIAFYLRCSD